MLRLDDCRGTGLVLLDLNLGGGGRLRLDDGVNSNWGRDRGRFALGLLDLRLDGHVCVLGRRRDYGSALGLDCGSVVGVDLDLVVSGHRLGNSW
jgi:hypothetical protein